MSTLQVANVHLESTGNNRIQYDGSNNFTIAAGDANVAVINSSSVSISTDLTIDGATTANTITTSGANVVNESATQTLTNKTLTSPTITSPIINVTSDATGDLYYRTAGGAFARLGVGTTDQVLTVASGLPSWADSSGGWVEIESNEIASDAGTITYTTTDFSNYNMVKVSVLGAFSTSDTNAGVDLQVEHSASWRTIVSFGFGSVAAQAAIGIDVNIYNVNDADSSGVVFAAGSGGVGSTLDITNNNASIGGGDGRANLGWSAYTGAITGIRLSITGGPSWEGSTSAARTNYILYGQRG